MRRFTLNRGSSGWAHPYGHGPFSPFLYADGGDGDGSGSTGEGSADGGDGGSGTADGTATGGDGDTKTAADGQGASAAGTTKGDTGKAGSDQAAEIARLTKELADTRKEAGKERTTAKETAAQEARNALVQDLGKALGLIKDEKATAPTAEQLTAQIEKATAAHRETATELAVFKGAAAHGADPGALTDSRAFMAQLGKLDPTDDKFTAKVDAAIKAAVADNPKLATASARTDSGSTDFNGTTGDKPDGPQSIDDIREARRKRRTG